MDYNNWLHDALVAASKEASHPELDFKVWSERDFESAKGSLSYESNKINVIVKTLASTISYDVKSTPIQILVWSESDSLDKCKDTLLYFTSANNLLYQSETSGGKTHTYKHSYTDPVILSAFQDHGAVIRAEFVIASTLIEIDGVADLSAVLGGVVYPNCVLIDGALFKPLTFSVSCSISPNSRSVTGAQLSQSVMGYASTSVTMAVPSIGGTLVNSSLGEMAGSVSTDTAHSFSFSIGSVEFSLSLRLTTCAFSTAPDNSPSIVMGFIT